MLKFRGIPLAGMMVTSELPFESIEEAVVEARKYVSSLILPTKSVEKGALSSIVSVNWRKGIPEGDMERVGAVDGSNNSDYLTLGQVIFVTSAALFLKDKRPLVARKYQIGLMDDYHYGERISFCREAMENKMALRAMELEPEVILLDGSFMAKVDKGLLSTPYGQRVPYFMRKILREMESRLKLDLTGDLISFTHLMEVSVEIEDLMSSILEEEKGSKPERDEVRRAMAFIERYEALVSLNELMRRRKGLLVAIAKRSSSRFYFNSQLPDMEVIRRYTGMESGFLVPRKTELRFPEFTGIESSYPIMITYARLERNAEPLRIEIVEGDESLLEPLLGSLARYSVKGYPYHLRRVHELTKIDRGLMDHLARNLLVPGISGRERLGE